MNPSEKAAYIKGLMEGMKFDTQSDVGKLIAKIVDLLEDLSLSVQDLEDEVAQLNDFTDELAHRFGRIFAAHLPARPPVRADIDESRSPAPVSGWPCTTCLW